MNGITKTALRLTNCIKAAKPALLNRVQIPVKRDFTRDIWHMCSSRNVTLSSGVLHDSPSNLCSCGCGMKAMHTKDTKGETAKVEKAVGEKELVEFLAEEIVAERKAQKMKTLPKELDGFNITADGAEIVFTKADKDETITITLNVNHTVDSDVNDVEPVSDKQDFAEMRSKPQFEVDIIKGDQTLGFTCSYLQEAQPQDGDEYNDIFGIEEITFYKGQWNDKVYAVAGDVLDGYLYDLLMNLLEEKGISNEFAQKLSDFSTAYEHTAYINLLEAVSKFTIGNK